MVNYRPFVAREPDLQYRNLLARILDNGTWVDSQQEEAARQLIGPQMQFKLSNGFPIITERDIVSPLQPDRPSQFAQGLGEHLAFLHGARTQTELASFGCTWWSRWVTEKKCRKRGLEPGDLGPGSYGPAWRAFPTSDPEHPSFDQITHVIEQIQELPHLRTHIVTPFIPQYLGRGKGKQQKVVVVPCHGFLHFFVRPAEKTISLHHFQRSADSPVGLVFNLVQYAALLLMVAQVTGYEADTLIYTISDAHIFQKQMGDVEDLLATEPACFPTVRLDPSITNIFDFRPEHFMIEDYYPRLPPRRIWTPV